MPVSTLVDLASARALQGDVVWVDARRAPAGEGLAGAVWADLDADMARAPSDLALDGRHPLPELEAWAATLGRWGIGPDTDVIAFDDAGGALSAARCWWMLRAVGHASVAVLDGGWQAIGAAGLPRAPLARSAARSRPPYPVPPTWLLPTVDIGSVPAPGRRLIDVRDAARYRGEWDPYDPVAGHIPGAINAPYRESLDAGGRFKPRAELERHLEDVLGPGPATSLVLSCGSGVTACHTLLALEHVGRPGAALFVGSWSAWSRSGRDIAP